MHKCFIVVSNERIYRLENNMTKQLLFCVLKSVPNRFCGYYFATHFTIRALKVVRLRFGSIGKHGRGTIILRTRYFFPSNTPRLCHSRYPAPSFRCRVQTYTYARVSSQSEYWVSERKSTLFSFLSAVLLPRSQPTPLNKSL